MKAPPRKHVSEMTDHDRREAECYFASLGIRSALMSWGPRGWAKLDEETRKAYLAMEILRYMAGKCQRGDMDWQEESVYGWSAADVWRALDVCRSWSLGNEPYGVRLAMYAFRSGKDDPFDAMFAEALR